MENTPPRTTNPHHRAHLATGPAATRRRDLLVTQVPACRLVLATDVVAGIGPRPGDVHPAEAVLCAHMAIRVPLLEVLCGGAEPVLVSNTISQDRESARPLIDEIRRVAASCGIEPGAVTGSTEDNVTTTSTGVSVTVIGMSDQQAPAPRPHPGDLVVCVGEPLSAPDDEVRPDRPEIVTIPEVRSLLGTGLVHDAVPVGSRGVGWEATQLAGELRVADLAAPFDPDHSGGPSTCVLLACSPGDVEALHALVAEDRPWNVVATLR